MALTPFVDRVGYINRTISAPKGLYVADQRGGVERGDWVVFSAIGRKAFPMPDMMIKQASYGEGTHIRVSREGVFVDGQRVGDVVATHQIRPYYMNRRLREGEVFVTTDHPRSYDSRYFGPVMAEELTKVRQLWTWG